MAENTERRGRTSVPTADPVTGRPVEGVEESTTATAIPEGVTLRNSGSTGPGNTGPGSAAGGSEAAAVRVGSHAHVAVVPAGEAKKVAPSFEELYGKPKDKSKEFEDAMKKVDTITTEAAKANDTIDDAKLAVPIEYSALVEKKVKVKEFDPETGTEKDVDYYIYGNDPEKQPKLSKDREVLITEEYYENYKEDGTSIRDGVKGTFVILSPDTDRARFLMHKVGYRHKVFLPMDVIYNLLAEGTKLQMLAAGGTDTEQKFVDVVLVEGKIKSLEKAEEEAATKRAEELNESKTAGETRITKYLEETVGAETKAILGDASLTRDQKMKKLVKLYDAVNSYPMFINDYIKKHFVGEAVADGKEKENELLDKVITAAQELYKEMEKL